MSRSTLVFEQHRSLLIHLAYRMLGSRTDAEDVVQEAWLRWDQGVEPIQQPKAWLCRVTVNLCLDHLKSAHHKRESYVGPWLPEPVREETHDAGLGGPLMMDYALQVTLERLNPLERAVFLLNEGLGYRYTEIAEMLDQKADNCRQSAKRAKQRLSEGRVRFEADPGVLTRLSHRFREALAGGDTAELLALFQRDIVLYADGGGKISAAARPVLGPDRVARFWQGIYRKMGTLQWHLETVSGGPGWILRHDGRAVLFVGFAGDERGISGLYLVRNPDKLNHLDSQANHPLPCSDQVL